MKLLGSKSLLTAGAQDEPSTSPQQEAVCAAQEEQVVFIFLLSLELQTDPQVSFQGPTCAHTLNSLNSLILICPELSSSLRGKPEQNRQDESQTYQLQILITSAVPALCPASLQWIANSMTANKVKFTLKQQLKEQEALVTRSQQPHSQRCLSPTLYGSSFPGPQPLASPCRSWGPGGR